MTNPIVRHLGNRIVASDVSTDSGISSIVSFNILQIPGKIFHLDAFKRDSVLTFASGGGDYVYKWYSDVFNDGQHAYPIRISNRPYPNFIYRESPHNGALEVSTDIPKTLLDDLDDPYMYILHNQINKQIFPKHGSKFTIILGTTIYPPKTSKNSDTFPQTQDMYLFYKPYSSAEITIKQVGAQTFYESVYPAYLQISSTVGGFTERLYYNIDETPKTMIFVIRWDGGLPDRESAYWTPDERWYLPRTITSCVNHQMATTQNRIMPFQYSDLSNPSGYDTNYNVLNLNFNNDGFQNIGPTRDNVYRITPFGTFEFTDGILGRACVFPGNSGNYLSRVTNDSAAFNYAGNTFMINLWINFTSIGGQQAIVEKFTNPSTGWRLYKDVDDKIVFGASGVVVELRSTTVVQTGIWYHVFCERLAGNIWNLWVNGVNESTKTKSGSINGSSNPLLIGARAGTGIYPLNAKLSEISVSYAGISPNPDKAQVYYNGGSGYSAVPTIEIFTDYYTSYTYSATQRWPTIIPSGFPVDSVSTDVHGIINFGNGTNNVNAQNLAIGYHDIIIYNHDLTDEQIKQYTHYLLDKYNAKPEDRAYYGMQTVNEL